MSREQFAETVASVLWQIIVATQTSKMLRILPASISNWSQISISFEKPYESSHFRSGADEHTAEYLQMCLRLCAQ